MAITLRNKAVEAKIKAIGRRDGLGPSAVIARAINRDEVPDSDKREALENRRRAAGRALRAMLPTLTAEDRAAIDQAMADMYDEAGLPRF